MITPADQLEFSIVVPAYNAGDTIAATLDSVFAPADQPALEVIVVDDGSDDGDKLRQEVARYPAARLVAHEKNRGMCAARNTGIGESRGPVVTILDADDRLVADWPAAFRRLTARWPADCQLCFAGCRNTAGQPTMREPGYDGPMDLAAFLSERYSGEYLPMFRGDYVRAKPYVDIGTRKSCGNLSYIAWLQDAPIYISAEVMRIYDDARGGAVSRNWLGRTKACESVRCLDEELSRYGNVIARLAPQKLSERWLKLAIYRRAAGVAGAWTAWRRGARANAPLATLAAAVMVAVGPVVTAALVNLAKRANVVRRYG
jgi:glycosyltransferase involved in cell wall biosynthesis